MNSDESFFESDVVQQELTDIQETYTQLLKISAGLADHVTITQLRAVGIAERRLAKFH